MSPRIPHEVLQRFLFTYEQERTHCGVAHGLCFCGCGVATPIATRNDSEKGLVKGYPLKYINGHNARKYSIGYRVEDRGYHTPCWVWQERCSTDGYGWIKVNGINRGTHRVFYEREYGSIPEGKQLDHLCAPYGGPHNCCRPDHLEAVAPAENSRRGRNAKLTVLEVHQIRRLLSETKLTQGQIGARFGVTCSTISCIKAGKRWRGA